MTLVDPELVLLIKSMYQLYADYGHGYFTTDQPLATPYSHSEAEQFVQVSPYKLYFKKPQRVQEQRGY